MTQSLPPDPRVFVVPDLGEGVQEAELLKWCVAAGQFVKELDVLAELETDKAVVEVPSPRSAWIRRLHGEVGEVIRVGAPLVTFADSQTPEASVIPEALVAALAGNTCVAFLGAGISAEAGYPTWFELVRKLLQWRSSHSDIAPAILESIVENIRQGDFNLAADALTADMPGGSGALAEFLAAQFPPPPALPPRMQLLSHLGFAAVMTSNFDQSIEQTFGSGTATFTHRDSESLLSAHSRNEFYVFKLCGSLSAPDTVALSPAQYENAVSSNLPLLTYMQSVFASKTLLFLGCSLSGIRDYLRAIRITPPGSESRHFALVEETPGWQSRAAQLNRYYGIQVLPFKATPGFPQVEQFMRDLLVQKQRAAAFSPGPSSQTQKHGIARVELENIGPYDKLAIDLDEHWSVLVGDNGVGKSSILKAIAIGIAGEEASEFALRVMKRGRTQASITLQTRSGKRYATQILARDISAHVSTSPGRMIEAENWLVLGFPPLRALTYSAIKEIPREASARLTAADVAPLLAGESDPRVNGIKEWLVALDYDIQRSTDSQRARLITEKFKHAFAALLPGSNIELLGVNPQTRSVMVRTPEGELPIEAVSQGSASIVGWVGVVLQRLFALATDPEQALSRFCLVLVDEIDAHMHPEWQRSLIQSVSRAIPSAQIIATSHSPLVAGNLEAGQLHRLRRESDGTISCKRIDKSFKGYRADQILTDEAFDLTTTMSKDLELIRSQYAILLGKSVRTPDEESQFRRLEQELELHIPAAAESPIERARIEERQQHTESGLANLDLQRINRLQESSLLAAARPVVTPPPRTAAAPRPEIAETHAARAIARVNRGELQLALEDYSTAIDIYAALEAKLHSSPGWTPELQNAFADALIARGDVRMSAEDPAAALNDYALANRILSNLVLPLIEDPDPYQLGRFLSVRAREGAANFAIGAIDAAKSNFEFVFHTVVMYASQLGPKELWPTDLQNQFAGALMHSGMLHRTAGNAAATGDLHEAVRIRAQLRDTLDPRKRWTTDLMADFADAMIQLALVRPAGTPDAAVAFSEAINVLVRLKKTLRPPVRWTTKLNGKLAFCWMGRATALSKIEAQRESALADFVQAIECLKVSLNKLCTDKTCREQVIEQLTISLRRRAALFSELGRNEEAEQDFDEIINLMSSNHLEPDGDPPR